MALDLCLESAGWVAQYVEANAANPLAMLRRTSRAGARSAAAAPSSAVSPTDIGPIDEAGVRQAAALLPISQAQAVWLIDVCGYGYSEAAASAGINRSEMAGRINGARQAIRHNLNRSDLHV